MKPLTSHTCKLTDAQAGALDAALKARDWKPRTVPYARFAYESDKCNVVFYESGKLVVQGKGSQEFIEFVLEPEILKEVKLGYETVLNPDLLLPRLALFLRCRMSSVARHFQHGAVGGGPHGCRTRVVTVRSSPNKLPTSRATGFSSGESTEASMGIKEHEPFSAR